MDDLVTNDVHIFDNTYLFYGDRTYQACVTRYVNDNKFAQVVNIVHIYYQKAVEAPILQLLS